MSAFDRTSYSSLWISIGGIIFLVATGLVISMIQDGLLTFKGRQLSSSEIKNQINAGKRRIHELSVSVEKLQERQDLNNRRKESSSKREILKNKLQEISLEIPRLQRTLLSEQSAAEQVELDYLAYRKKARNLRWSRAIGKRLDNIVNPSGGYFKEATILKIDAEGITIRHLSGTSRLSIYQLSQAHLQKFDLSASEAKAVRHARLKAAANRSQELKKNLSLRQRLRTNGTSGKDVEHFFKVD